MKKTIKNFFTFFAAFSLSAQVQMVNKPLPLNGKLTERGWQNIQVQSGFKYPSGKGSKTPLAQTSFRIAADKSNLYVSILCHENKMDKLRKTDGKSLLWTTDCVELFLSPTGHPDEFYQFAVSASNVRFSMFYAEAGGIRPDPYLPFWDSKVFYGTNYWLVQIKIPFSAFYMTRNADWSSNWRLNVARTRMPVAETSSWSSLQGSFLEPHNFRMFSGFPKRNPAHDISIKNVKPTITNFNNGIYFGSLALLIEANAAAAGKYQLIVEEPEGRSSVHEITVNSGLNKIVLPQMEYLRKFPKTNLKLTIKSKKTGFVSGRHYPADFFYEPVRLEVSNPCYKNNFYPGQDHSQISGKLHLRLSATQKKGGSCSVDYIRRWIGCTHKKVQCKLLCYTVFIQYQISERGR